MRFCLEAIFRIISSSSEVVARGVSINSSFLQMNAVANSEAGLALVFTHCISVTLSLGILDMLLFQNVVGFI